MFRYTYECDCCGIDGECRTTDDTISAPLLPDTWRRFYLEKCIPDPRSADGRSWEAENEHVQDLCPDCAAILIETYTSRKDLIRAARSVTASKQ